MENPYPPLIEAHIIPLAILKEILRNSYYDVMPARYKKAVIGGLRPWCSCTSEGCKGEWGILGGVTKDGNENGVTIVTSSGEYTLYTSYFNVTDECIIVKLKTKSVIPKSNVTGVYMAWSTRSGRLSPHLVSGYNFRINKETDTLTVIHCRI